MNLSHFHIQIFGLHMKSITVTVYIRVGVVGIANERRERKENSVSHRSPELLNL